VKTQLIRCTGGYALIALAILTLPQPDLLLPIFFVLFAASYLAHGASTVPNFDVIGKTVSSSRCGPFFTQRNLKAVVMGFGAGLVVRQILK